VRGHPQFSGARHCRRAPQRLQPQPNRTYFPACQNVQCALQWLRGAEAAEWHVSRFLPYLLALALAVACAHESPSVPPDAASAPLPAPVIQPHEAALGRDPEAMSEPLRDALKQFRDKFACNQISGCPAESVLRQLGWQTRPYLQQLFEKAPEQAQYRSRAVRVLAELQDPLARNFLRDRLQDTDPEVRAYAIFGLGLLDDRWLEPLLPTIGRDDATAWMASVRLSALWQGARWGDRTAEPAFLRQMAMLAEQQMAVQGLIWGLALCMRDDGPNCQTVLPLVARHPNFLVRRSVAKAMARAPLPSFAAGLVALTTETARSIAEPAEQALRALSGQDLHGASDWRRWCEATQCQRAADEAIAQLQAAATATAP
jgi:hypothetical protein